MNCTRRLRRLEVQKLSAYFSTPSKTHSHTRALDLTWAIWLPALRRTRRTTIQSRPTGWGRIHLSDWSPPLDSREVGISRLIGKLLVPLCKLSTERARTRTNSGRFSRSLTWHSVTSRRKGGEKAHAAAPV